LIGSFESSEEVEGNVGKPQNPKNRNRVVHKWGFYSIFVLYIDTVYTIILRIDPRSSAAESIFNNNH